MKWWWAKLTVLVAERETRERRRCRKCQRERNARVNKYDWLSGEFTQIGYLWWIGVVDFIECVAFITCLYVDANPTPTHKHAIHFLVCVCTQKQSTIHIIVNDFVLISGMNLITRAAEYTNFATNEFFSYKIWLERKIYIFSKDKGNSNKNKLNRLDNVNEKREKTTHIKRSARDVYVSLRWRDQSFCLVFLSFFLTVYFACFFCSSFFPSSFRSTLKFRSVFRLSLSSACLTLGQLLLLLLLLLWFIYRKLKATL